jgi:hypothetical protein
LRQAFGDQPPQDPRQRNPLSAAGNRQQSEQLANEKDKMAADLDRLEQDMQKAAHDMNGTQPGAASRLREGLSEIQQTEAKLRMKFSANYIRQGQGGYMVPREQPLTDTLDKVSQDIRRAQDALNNGAKQQAGSGNGDIERSLAQVERLRSQMERMAGRGQQQGDQQGNGQEGQQGQQGNGQQAGNSPQGGGSQRGGGYTGGPHGARYAPGPRYGGGRYFQEGLYDLPDVQPLDPQRMARDATRELNELRQMFKDNPDVSREIVDLENEIQKLTFGATAGPELQNRINREVLPNLEALEVQLRWQLDEQNGGQVRSGASDKVPSGYVDAVAEYFRKLSREVTGRIRSLFRHRRGRLCPSRLCFLQAGPPRRCFGSDVCRTRSRRRRTAASRLPDLPVRRTSPVHRRARHPRLRMRHAPFAIDQPGATGGSS